MNKHSDKKCKHNNNGWCEQKGKSCSENCNLYKSSITILRIERGNKDYYGQELLKLQINDEIVEIPELILERFIQDKHAKSQEINISN